MIKAWLLRSEEYPAAKYWAVIELLQGFAGPIKFLPTEEPVEIDEGELTLMEMDEEVISKKEFPLYAMDRRPQISLSLSENYRRITWEDLFAKCAAYRVAKHIKSKDFVILLTEHVNQYSWFTAGEPSGARNLFVHTAFWEYFSGSDQRFPVAYHVAAAILKALTFKDYKDLTSHLHRETVGCINDFCADKKDVAIKLRTADICPSCLSLLQERGVNPQVIKQVFSIIEGLRDQMLFKRRWKLQESYPTMLVSGYNRNISFPELGNLQIRLSPLEKSLYLLFLNKPEGIRLRDLPEYQKELEEIYGPLYTGPDPEAIAKHMQDLCNPNSNSASEKISRIKQKFSFNLGKELAEHYIIQGPNGGLKKVGVSLEKNHAGDFCYR